MNEGDKKNEKKIANGRKVGRKGWRNGETEREEKSKRMREVEEGKEGESGRGRRMEEECTQGRHSSKCSPSKE